MQAHQIVLAMGILWLVSLIVLPFLFMKARSHAFNRGLEIGKQHHKAELKLQIKALQGELEVARIESEASQRKHHTNVCALKASISELEARIMSYTGLAVTRADYEKLLAAASIIRLAQRTFTALKSQPEADRAAAQASVIEALAKRIHTQLRDTPAACARTEAAA